MKHLAAVLGTVNWLALNIQLLYTRKQYSYWRQLQNNQKNYTASLKIYLFYQNCRAILLSLVWSKFNVLPRSVNQLVNILPCDKLAWSVGFIGQILLKVNQISQISEAILAAQSMQNPADAEW